MTAPTFLMQDKAPLYPKIIWNRPVSKHGAGRLLITGGHSADFSMPTAIYGVSQAAGIGECRVALPDSLLKLLAGAPATTFVASSPSGSLGREALGRLLHLAEDVDATIIGAGISNNSETAVLTERLLQELEQPVIGIADALVALQFNPKLLTERTNALIILTMPELFKLAGQLLIPIQIRRNGGIMNKVDIIWSIRRQIKADIVVYGTETIVAGYNQISVTPANPVLSRLPAAYYGVLGTFWLQNPSQKIEGLTTGAWILSQAGKGLSPQETPTVGKVGAAIVQALEQAEE